MSPRPGSSVSARAGIKPRPGVFNAESSLEPFFTLQFMILDLILIAFHSVFSLPYQSFSSSLWLLSSPPLFIRSWGLRMGRWALVAVSPAQWRAPLLYLSPVQSPVTLKTELRAYCTNVQENWGHPLRSLCYPFWVAWEASVSPPSPASYKHAPVFVQVFVHGCYLEPSHFEEEVVFTFSGGELRISFLCGEERERKN